MTIDRVELVMLTPEDLQTQDRGAVPMLDQAAHAIHVLVVDGIVRRFAVDRPRFKFAGEGAAMCRRRSLRLAARHIPA